MHPGDDAALDTRANEAADLILRLVRRMRAPAGDTPPPDELLDELGRSGLARRHMTVLVTLALHEPVSVGELAGYLTLSPATTSQLVNELNRAGLVQRREDEADRRRTIVELPARYRTMIMPLAEQRLAVIRRALEAMPCGDQAAFLRGLQLLVDTAEGAAPRAPRRVR